MSPNTLRSLGLLFPIVSLAVLTSRTPLLAQDPNYTFAVLHATGTPGSEVELAIVLENTSVPVAGFSFGLATDTVDVLAFDYALGPDLQSIFDGFGPDFTTADFPPQPAGGTGFVFGTVFSFFATPFLGFGVYDVLRVSYQIDAAASGPYDVCFTDTLADPPFPIAVIVGGQSVLAVTECGVVDVVELVYLRGDANGDGTVDIADPIFLGGALFVTSDFLPCADASDANDDGLVDIADVVYVPQHLFSSGPPPPPPFPECGFDPTDDVLGCETPLVGCF